MPIPDTGKAPLYSGAVDCVVKTVKMEGIRGLYKGNVHQPRLYSPSKIIFYEIFIDMFSNASLVFVY